MKSNFFSNKRVLVTGHTGFKGCWLTKWLSLCGAKVIGLSLLPEKASVYSQLALPNVTDYFADIRKEKTVRDIVAKEKPEIVFHLAAQAIVGRAAEEPLFTFTTNVSGTANLLDALRECESVRSIVVVTSDKVYENFETEKGYQEGDRLGGYEPYSASKACEEWVAAAYRETFFRKKKVGLATARATNAYGGADLHFDRLIPYLAKALHEGKPAQIRNPHAVRPWQYILDLLQGYCTLAEELYQEPGSYSEGWNFGPSEKEIYTVEQIAAMLMGEQIEVVENQIKEATLLMVNSEKSRARLSFAPVYTVREGLEKTAAFYCRHLSGERADALMEEEICGYEKDREERKNG